MDSLTNAMTGAGTTADKRIYARYRLDRWSPDQIEAAYRSSWLMRKAVDLPPYDMTRAWRNWQAKGDQIERLEAEERRLDLRAKIRRALILGRLGGGAILLGVGRGDPAMPLLPDQLRQGELKFLHVISRWQLQFEGGIIRDPTDENFGQPSLWRLTDGKGGGALIHPSRVVAFTGQAVPDFATVSEEDAFWGDSIPQAIGDAVKNADAAQNGFASLIDEASIDTIGIPDMLAMVGTEEGESRLLRRLELMKLGQSMHRARLKDAAETWETRQVNWAGMTDVISAYVGLVAGATDIPATRLLGKSPDGMNATGEGDRANYDRMIAGRQETDLAPQLARIDELLIRSALGSRDPDIFHAFAPLSLLSETETAGLFKTMMEAMTALRKSGTIPPIAFAKAMQNLLVEKGWIPGLDGALAEIAEEARFGGKSGEESEGEGAGVRMPAEATSALGREGRLPSAD
ncbi:DUF1073 domain-containing protein [Sphingomonas oleivorans]|nr:DUF1073 domain-containing protein [Sphingomonas oleivorans]